MQIVVLNKQGLSPEEISVHHPHINLNQVNAALTYYHMNPEEIENELRVEKEEIQRLEQEYLQTHQR